MTTPPIKHNPGILGEDELVRAFVVRGNCLELILETIRDNENSGSANRHLLVVGPRGIGKTMLVRRTAVEVRRNPDYSRRWRPIVFGEESYQVSSAGEFWLEALIHLSQQPDGPRWEKTIDELREEQNDARLRERALGQLREFADHEGRGLLLVVENLNMLREQISGDAAWELRHTLASEGRIMLLGTATSRFDAITNPGEAWYEFFALHELRPLDRAESGILWRALTKEEVTAGQMRAIRILTGGNPRLLTVLSGFAAKRSFRELMEQLVHLIDDHTEYFKGHLDALPPKERKVFVALLEYWNPVTAASLAHATRFGVNEVSSLLNRLAGRGAVEIAEQRPRRKLYQATERLYNIYYLMRRRGRPADRVRAAVSFMVMFYGGRKLASTIAELARKACGLPATERGDHFAAFAELACRTPEGVWTRALEESPVESFRYEDAPETIRGELKDAKLTAVFNRAADSTRAGEWGRSLGRLAEAEEAFRKAAELEPEVPCHWRNLGRLLSSMDRLPEAEEACRRSVEVDSKHHPAWNGLGHVLRRAGKQAEAEKAFRRAIELNPEYAPAWASLGALLQQANQFEQAKEALRTAVELRPNEPGYWDNLGHLVSTVGPPEEAERVWAEALRLHPGLALCAAHLLDARLQLGGEAAEILNEAKEWVERGGRSAGLLDSMARLVLRWKMEAAYPQAEAWAREAVAQKLRGPAAVTLALALAAQGRWVEALDVSRPALDATAKDQPMRESGTDFLVQAAAAGYAREALVRIEASAGASALEPLVAGLRIYLGETPQVAKEILEIGRDLADHIRELSMVRST